MRKLRQRKVVVANTVNKKGLVAQMVKNLPEIQETQV